jgi:sestrin
LVNFIIREFIQAASQHKCQYIVSKLTDDFLINGGNIDWLQGLQHTPTKIRNLAKLNTILAHQPWRLQAADIGALVRGAPNPQDNWTTSEIVHIIVILSTFHSLSSFVLGCGIVPEYDSIGGYIYEQSSNEDPGSCIGIMNPQEISPADASGLNISLNQEQSGEPDTERSIIEPAKPIDIPNKSPPIQKQTVDVESLKHTTQLIQRLKETSLQEDNYGTSNDDSSFKPVDTNKLDEIVEFENVEEESE